MTVRTVTLPDLGEGLTESELVDWLVAPGDVVALNQVVADVETAKALVQLPSPYAGVVAELLAEPGTTVPVGGALLTITVAEPNGSATDTDPPADAAGAGTAADVGEPASAGAPARNSVLVGYGPPVEGSGPSQRRARSARWVSAHSDVGVPVGSGGPTNRHATNPLVRKLAHDLGVHLERVIGSGLGGAITRDDVLRTVSSPHADPGAPRRTARTGSSVVGAPSESAEVRIPVTGVRKQTAAAMVASAFTAPHASVFLNVDVTPTLDLVTELRADPAFADRRVTVLTIVAKALTVALGRNPALNAHWDQDAGEIVRYGHVGLGIAVDTPRGLLVPVVRDADRLRLPALADVIRDLTEAARLGTTTPADLTGGTITITNVGVFGVDGGTPILVPGQAAILAMGAVRRQPWEHEDQVALRSVMTLSMSFDHRLVDGAEAARFLADLGAILAQPGAALAMV